MKDQKRSEGNNSACNQIRISLNSLKTFKLFELRARQITFLCSLKICHPVEILFMEVKMRMQHKIQWEGLHIEEHLEDMAFIEIQRLTSQLSTKSNKSFPQNYLIQHLTQTMKMWRLYPKPPQDQSVMIVVSENHFLQKPKILWNVIWTVQFLIYPP